MARLGGVPGSFLRSHVALSDAPLAAAAGGTLWIEPFLNRNFESSSPDPAEIVAARSSLRLALVASLQHLPARQRAVFLLREVLAYTAADVARMLDMTVPRSRAPSSERAPSSTTSPPTLRGSPSPSRPELDASSTRS
jgi:RNA polymerase sigma-70 factor, ECF subfamily